MGMYAQAAQLAMSAYGAYQQGQASSNSAGANAATYREEAATTLSQGYEAEAQQRRRGADVIGREVTAAGQAGAGYGGSVGRSIRQSAVNTELDALNIRYKAGLQAWAYRTQGANLSAESGIFSQVGNMRAGAALLKGYSNYTSGTNLGG